KQRSILNCIECYACQAVCPVFKFINSDQNNFNKGPVDCIKEPLLQGFEKASHLAYACTLCGKCEEVCPMSISLPELILHNRKEAAEKGYYVCVDKSHMKTLKKMFLKRKTLESPYHRLMLKLDFKKDYGNQRVFPDFGQKSFHIIWTEGYGIYTEKD
ncbi:MAG: 4Fe-4S dicluster domain-containing protein, partial [Bacteroidales bacterium]